MSDDESKDIKSESHSDVGICHDFLRNACKFGMNCKFKHPEGAEKKRSYSFCHDYQNSECRRINCKFLHCTRQEEQQYRLTGELPRHVLDSQSARRSSAAEQYSGNGQWPICKDFLKGDCRRGSSCRFRHASDTDRNFPHRSSGARDGYDSYNRYQNYDSLAPELKRRAFDDPYSSLMSEGSRPPEPLNRMPPAYNEYCILEEENYLMRKKVEDLKKQISELTATNEFLLDENARLRFAKQSTVSSVTQSMNSLNAMTPTMATMTQLAMGNSNLTAQCMGPAEITMPLGVPVTLGQGVDQNYSYSQMPVNTQESNLVSYPIIAQRMRPGMP